MASGRVRARILVKAAPVPLPLGPFDLYAPVARGGTGEVWRALHRTQGTPVAVKVVSVDIFDERSFRARFAREVQSMAQLSHPAVARIHDYGDIAPALAERSNGRLPERAPWLAMEWLGGGPLDVSTIYEWPVLRATLLTLLDALAHAHAHEVIHLDLKPDNVLLAERGPVLTDFGLAFSVAGRQSFRDNQVFGTPGYMAPEQIHGQWRDYGPWTDLYALGCLAYELVCGHVPHGADQPGPLPLMLAHVTEPLPALAPRMTLPAGFALWLDRLLARNPGERFRFAADAAVALLALPAGVDLFDGEATASFESIAEALGSVEWIAGDTSLNRSKASLVADENSLDAARPATLDETVDFPVDELHGGQPILPALSSIERAATPPGAFEAIDTAIEALDLEARLNAEVHAEDLPFADDRGPRTAPAAPIDPEAAEVPVGRDPDATALGQPPVLGIEETVDAQAVFEAFDAGKDLSLPDDLRDLVGRGSTSPAIEALPASPDEPVGLLETTELRALRPVVRSAPVAPRPPTNRTLVMGPVFLPIDDTSWAAGPGPDGRPPMPATWNRQGPTPPPPLIDAGEALVRLRTPPPVGRTAERDALWHELRRAVGGETRLVLIEGPAGQGKTHLAHWLCRRAHELGVADQLRVHHAASGDETSGVAPALVRHLRLQDLDHRDRLDRIRALTGDALDPEASRAFAASLVREQEVTGVTSALLIQSESELDAARAGGLLALCDARPLVLHLDDVQWSWSSIRFALHLLDRHADVPLLMVLTVRDDALRPGSLERKMTERLAAHPRTRRIRLGPLEADDLTRLVTSLLPVEPRLTSALVQRTHGNPLFAVELMRHWIGEGALVPGPEGFRLARRALTESLPGSQRAVWSARLSHALRRAEASAGHALELAAVLGPVVHHSEWALVCAAARLNRPRESFRRLVDERLVRPLADGQWTFGNAMLREVLLETAREGDRWQRWHSVCADVLARDEGVDPGRLLHHLAEAGRDKEALPPALDLADRQIDRGAFVDAEGTLLEAAGMLRRIRQPLGSRPWVEISLRWSHACIARGRTANGLRRALCCELLTRQSGNAHLRSRTLLAVARARYAAGQSEAALRALQGATRAADQARDRRLSARVRNAAGRCLVELGRFTQARLALDGALDSVRGIWAPRLNADARRHLADMARRAGRHTETLEHAQAALDLYRQIGARQQQGQVELLIGDSYRHRGQPEDAAEHYRTARRLLRAAEAIDAPIADLDLALVILDLGQYHEARPLLEAALDAVSGHAGRGAVLSAIAQSFLVACAAAERDWETWDRHLDALTPLVQGAVVDPDIARGLRLGGRLALHAGETARAHRAVELAVRQLHALSRDADAGALKREVGL